MIHESAGISLKNYLATLLPITFIEPSFFPVVVPARWGRDLLDHHRNWGRGAAVAKLYLYATPQPERPRLTERVDSRGKPFSIREEVSFLSPLPDCSALVRPVSPVSRFFVPFSGGVAASGGRGFSTYFFSSIF